MVPAGGDWGGDEVLRGLPEGGGVGIGKGWGVCRVHGMAAEAGGVEYGVSGGVGMVVEPLQRAKGCGVWSHGVGTFGGGKGDRDVSRVVDQHAAGAGASGERAGCGGVLEAIAAEAGGGAAVCAEPAGEGAGMERGSEGSAVD